MRLTTAVLLLFIPVVFADNQEKSDKKALEQQAQTFVKEAKDLEKAGKLLEARTSYANSQSFAETHDAAEAIKRIDGEIQKRVKSALQQAHRLYDQGKYEPAAQTLDQASQMGGSGSVFSYDLALCKQRLGDTASALGHQAPAAIATADPKRKLKIKQLRTAWVTGEQPPALKNDDRDRINKVNQLMDSIGFETSVEDRQPSLTPPAEAGSATNPPSRSAVSPVSTHTSKAALRSVSLCQALDGLKGPLAQTPAITFDLANCAEDTDRPADAAQLLGHYLELAPQAADAERVRLRIAKLNALVELPEPKGAQVRGLYASASRFLEERKYDGALADFQRAAEAAPEFAPTAWRLALMYEAMGKLDRARKSFATYRQLETSPAGQEEADLHLNTLDAKGAKYDEEIDHATEILSDLFNRAMNLTFNGLEDRASQYKHLARARAKVYAKQKLRVVGGFTVPFAYAQQQLEEAGEHLATTLLLFPLGAEANQLMGLVFLQANDGRSSMRSFDAVASQNLPVAFYAQMHANKADHAVKCELTQDRLRLIFLSSYDKQGKPAAPAKPAGEDGLGDLAIDPLSERTQEFESRIVMPAEIKSIETKNGFLVLKLAKEEITLAPIYLPAIPPAAGPAARRFANNYTRLFVRYPGLEESKLGAEGMTAFEKVKFGYDLANAGFGIAMSLNPMGAIGALESFVQISKEVHGVANSTSVTFAGWVKTIEDQQELQAGNTFKSIPTEPASLAFLEEIK